MLFPSHWGGDFKGRGRFKMKLLGCLLAFVCIVGCGSDNTLTGEDHGNLAVGESGLILTQTEHEEGWGEANCFFCHNMANIHQTDRTGTGLNLEAIRTLTEEEGLDSCVDCHGTNGL